MTLTILLSRIYIAAHKILPVSNERWAGRSKIKNAANRRKTACSGAFGVPDTTRTCDPGLRRLVLYPTELLGHISKLFNFSAQTDSNELPLRSCKDCFPFRHGISLSIPKNACIWAFVDVLHPTLSHVVPRKNPRH